MDMGMDIDMHNMHSTASLGQHDAIMLTGNSDFDDMFSGRRNDSVANILAAKVDGKDTIPEDTGGRASRQSNHSGL